MPIVQSFGALQAMTDRTWSATPSGSLQLYGLNQIYGEIYRTQPNVRICVDFLARNIAQLGLRVFRRISDTDRERLNGHDLARWLKRPNPSTTGYRLIESLVSDLAIYFNAYWLKVRYEAADGRPALGFVRLPPEEMGVAGGLLPTHFVWTANGRKKDLALSEVVFFNGYNPLNPLVGLSPMETLRRILAEEQAAGEYRESLWSRSAKHEGLIERSKDAPKWTPDQRRDFRQQWQEYSASKSGQTAILEDGMTYKPTSFSAKESEYIAGGKLRREVCAATWHIPQPMVGILEHATFSNVKEQHKHTYMDCLGPWCEMITQEIESQALVECDDQADVYTDFNIDAKLAGTPEERSTSLSQSIGRPWRTVNEGRALENLPRLDKPEYDDVAPQQGGPSDASVGGADDLAATASRAADVADVIQRARARQDARLAAVAVDERPAAFNLARWNTELAADLEPLLGAAAAARLAVDVNADVLRRLRQEAADV